MKVNSKELKTAVENCCRIVPKKAEHAILACVRIKGKKRGVNIMATNLEEFYSAKVLVKKGETFDITVNADQLLKVLKNIKDEELELELERGAEPKDLKVRITSGMTFRLKAEFHDGDFPIMPVKIFKKSSKVEVHNQKVLFEILKKVGFSTTAHNINRAYNGILFAGKKTGLELVTTDIHRLSVVRTEVAKTKKDFVSLSIHFCFFLVFSIGASLVKDSVNHSSEIEILLAVLLKYTDHYKPQLTKKCMEVH